MTMVAQKFKILSKRKVRGSALATLSKTKQGFTVSLRREEGKCVWGMGYAIFVNFCSCLLFLCLLLIYFFQLDMVFSIAFILRN